MPSTPLPRDLRHRPALDDADDAYERVVVPFARRRQSLPAGDEGVDLVRARRGARYDPREGERSGQMGERRLRRRRRSGSWLQRNALSVAAVALLFALLGVGFGITQVLTRSTTAPAMLATAPTSQAGGTPAVPAQPGAQESAPAASSAPLVRQVTASTRVLEPTYTVRAGDTLGSIAARFNTTVQRIQAFNDLADPRILSVGQKLVIPPPL